MTEPRQVLSPACHDGHCDTCTGYTGGYDTWRCTHRCHNSEDTP